MRFAHVNGQREEAQPGLTGECPGCEKPVLARCGEVRVWHWSHRGQRLCDPWWENETEWHRAWKNHFPVDWQEVVHPAPDGQRHIADVRTGDGWVIEFQHSAIKPEERRSREAFYPKLIWVIDGTRRKRDALQFGRAWKDGSMVSPTSRIRQAFTDECGLLREWGGSKVPVFLDFGEADSLWFLYPESPAMWTWIEEIPRTQFVKTHAEKGSALGSQFTGFMAGIPKMIADYEAHRRAQQHVVVPRQRAMFRRRFRF